MFSKLFGPSVPQMTPQQAQERLNAAPKPVLVDVREPDEFRMGHIQGAKLIPLGDLSGKMKELPKNQEIIVVCQSGSRSSVAARQLAAQGYQVVNLQGGMGSWSRAGLPVKR